MIEIIILLCLIFLNGLFVMIEIALVSVRKTRLESMAENGDDKARSALRLAENPDLFLPVAQLGITLIAILTGFYSGEKFSGDLKPYIEKIAFLKHYANGVSTALIVIPVTFASIIFGELIPKRIGLMRAEKISRIAASPMKFLSRLGYPIVSLLNFSSNLFFRIFPMKSLPESNVTEEEIKAIINEGTEQGTIEEAEQEIIERVFHLSDRNITSLMTHRSDIIWFGLDENEETIKEKIIREPHSVYPICDGQIDDIKGVVSIKDLYVSDDSIPFRELMSPAMFVPENNSAYKILEIFRESRIHSCFIVDEYGSLLGMITFNDILEAIVGDIPQPDVEDYEIKQREDGSFLVDAQVPFYDFLSHFNRTNWMREDAHEFDTLAGFILHHLERIPDTGETLDWKDFRFEVVDMDNHRIDKVLVTLLENERDEKDEN